MIIIIIFLFAALAGIDFIVYCVAERRIMGKIITGFVSLVVVIGSPWIFLSMFDIGLDNDCCNDSAVFSPEHSFTMYFWIGLITIAYFYSEWRTKLAPPIIEVIVNCLLIAGIALNVVLGFHLEDMFFIAGNLPIILLFLIALATNQRKVQALAAEGYYEADGHVKSWALKVLTAKPLSKFPLLTILCAPIIAMATAILMLFGQKADSVIRAFTDTYSHGLSQWDYMCDNVVCGGHYLCSVAANGHQKIVKPVRLGERNGGTIVCNRQLLISNAFEEVLETKTPKLHRFIRRNYNKVGDKIHKHYHVFENKYLSDVIYILMKPLELVFWLVLYTTQRNPENSIARQYLSKAERAKLVARQEAEKAKVNG
ncbi:MAG: hypothetical protein GQ574_07685 [Crocinitomix sp.]|nr:hypothetical protein [Crocinitomix sp.]